MNGIGLYWWRTNKQTLAFIIKVHYKDGIVIELVGRRNEISYTIAYCLLLHLLVIQNSFLFKIHVRHIFFQWNSRKELTGGHFGLESRWISLNSEHVVRADRGWPHRHRVTYRSDTSWHSGQLHWLHTRKLCLSLFTTICLLIARIL